MSFREWGYEKSKRYKGFDKDTMTLEVWLSEIDECFVFPCKYEVCPTCQGKGSHVNPSIDSNGISTNEFYEDPEFAESYFSGRFDEPCYECKGDRVVPEVDNDVLTEDEKEHYEMYQEQLRDDWYYFKERQAEIRYGC